MSDNPFDRLYRLDSKGRVQMKSARRMVGFSCSRPDCERHDNKDDPKFKKCARVALFDCLQS